MLITPPYSSIKDITDVTFLPIPNGGAANAINAQNMIVGTSGNNSRIDEYAFAYLYDGVSVNNLGTLGGLRSGAYDINDFDQVVGYSESASGSLAFIWDQANGMRDLNVLVTANGWVLSSAAAINNAGDIVGTGLLNGQPHGFLLTSSVLPPPPPPVNEPPVAVATSDVSSGKVALTVNFLGDQSYDPDGSIAAYVWDFGDGTTSSTDMNPSHIYSDVGTYICVLTITDDKGMTDSAQLDIPVRKSKGKPK
jgi:probable HAF family extracellular repeat protein